VTKTKIIKLRVSEEEHALLALRAVRLNTTLTNLVRAGVGLEAGMPSTYAERANRAGVRA
jgi:hypothetical protein